MPGAVVESNVYSLWVAKQTAYGSPAAAATKRLIQVAGGVGGTSEYGSENWSDGSRFGDATDYVNNIAGGGAPTIEAQPDELAYLCWLFFGGETVTGTGPFVHVFQPGNTGSFWCTFWQKIGLSTIVRQKHNDMRISSLRIEGSTANKIVKVTPTLVGADPREIFVTDPTPTTSFGTAGAASDNAPWLYTEGKSRFMVDGTALTGHSQFAFIVEDALAPVYGDDVSPYAFVPGLAQVRLEAITMVLDDASIPQYYKIMYGTPTPTTGAKPLRSLAGQALGSWTADLQRNGVGAAALQRFMPEVAGVRWTPDLDLTPNPDGGPIELALTGGGRKSGANPRCKITINNNSPAYTV